MPRQLLIVYLPIYMYFQPQLMMNRLMILLVVAVAMVMCSVSCEGKKNFFIVFFFLFFKSTHDSWRKKRSKITTLNNFGYWILISTKFKIIILFEKHQTFHLVFQTHSRQCKVVRKNSTAPLCSTQFPIFGHCLSTLSRVMYIYITY